MYYLYVLRSISFSRHYIGITASIKNRLDKHNAGEVISTKAYRPWELAYVEEFREKTPARKREIFLKRTALARKELFEKLDRMAPSSNG